MVRTFIPEACLEAALEELMIDAYGHDIEITQVPSGRDEMAKAAIDAAIRGLGVMHVQHGEFFKKTRE